MKERVGLVIPSSLFLADAQVFPFCGVLKVAYEQMASAFDTAVVGDGEEAVFEAITRDGVIDAGTHLSPHFRQRTLPCSILRRTNG